MSETVAIEVLYRFDENRRVYQRDANGRPFGGPIYCEHFRPFYVVGYEKRSLLVSHSPEGTFPQKMTRASLLTADQVNEMCWLHVHRYQIRSLVENCQDTAKLKAVADILGYVP